MDVEILYIQGCPNVEVCRERVLEAARRLGVTVDLRERLVLDERDAAVAGMRGSPTVLVAGVDVSDDGAPPSLSCRLYRGADGPSGAPALGTILTAIERIPNRGVRAGRS